MNKRNSRKFIKRKLTQEAVFVPQDVKDKIKNYLDKDAFVWGNKSIWAYKDGKVPGFDFSGITFDISKQVKTFYKDKDAYISGSFI